MVRNGTFPPNVAASVEAFVDGMPASAKLRGLGVLVDSLIAQRRDDWRMVVFTGSRETQTTIQEYLLGRKIPVGIINGDSPARNQETIRRFWKMPQECRVIVSTEAGSEGVNLQAANVLVNYDLPWI
jgi:superfamily II DNA/RNA helicase